MKGGPRHKQKMQSLCLFKKCFTKKSFLKQKMLRIFCQVCIFCFKKLFFVKHFLKRYKLCVVALPSNTIFVRKTLLFTPFPRKGAGKGYQNTFKKSKYIYISSGLFSKFFILSIIFFVYIFLKKYNFCSIITKNGKRYQKKGYSKTIPKNFLPKKIIDKIKKIVSHIGKRYKFCKFCSIITKNGKRYKKTVCQKRL